MRVARKKALAERLAEMMIRATRMEVHSEEGRRTKKVMINACRDVINASDPEVRVRVNEIIAGYYIDVSIPAEKRKEVMYLAEFNLGGMR